MCFYHRIMRPKDADEMARAVWSAGSTLFAQTDLSENLGSLLVTWTCILGVVESYKSCRPVFYVSS